MPGVPELRRALGRGFASMGVIAALLAAPSDVAARPVGLRAAPRAQVRGFVALPGRCDPAKERRAWRVLARLDAEIDPFLAERPDRFVTERRQVWALERREQTSRRLVDGLTDVFWFGCMEPAVTALTRMGEIHEAQSSWIASLPEALDTPRLPTDLYAIGGCPLDVPLERARAAYEQALHLGYAAGLHGYPPVDFAWGRLQVLDPEEHPETGERWAEGWR